MNQGWGLWAAAAALLLTACGGKEGPKALPPTQVDVLTLQPSPVRETGEYLGALLSRQDVTVLPQVAGYVRKIHVKPGQTVEAGAPLVEIDARQESAALQSAQAQRSSAAANRQLAEQTRARSEALYAEGLISAQELERAQAQAEAALAAAQAAQAQVAQRAVQLHYYDVKAPFAGTVGDVLVRVGDFVNATTRMTSIAQADVLEVTVAVPSERARTLQVGSPVELLDREGEVLLSTSVFFVAPQADPRTQLVEVKAAFRNVAGLRPSELVRTRVVYGERDALQVPALAVTRQSGQPFTFVVRQDPEKGTVAQRLPVRLGALGASSYVVEGGLQAGDRIVVSSLQTLRDGAPIQPRPVKAEAPPARPPGATAAAATGAGGDAGQGAGGGGGGPTEALAPRTPSGVGAPVVPEGAGQGRKEADAPAPRVPAAGRRDSAER